MRTDTIDRPKTEPDREKPVVRKRGRKSIVGMSMLAQGEPMIWLTGGALAISLIMIVGLIGTVLYFGLGTFIAQPAVQYELLDGTIVAGEVTRYDVFEVSADSLIKNPVVGDAFLKNMVDELGGGKVIAGLPDLIKHHSTDVQVRLDDVNGKFARVEELIVEGEAEVADRLAAVSGGQDTVADRLAIIRASAEPETLKNRRAELETLRGKQVSLKSQIDSNQKAIDYLAGKSSETASGGDPAPAAEADNAAVASDSASDAAAEQSGPLQKILTAPEPVKKSVLNALMEQLADQRGERHLTARRRLVRTGNKSPQNTETFKWVADYEIKPDSTLEETPEWFAVVERTEWGRFYGTPEQFVIHHERPVPAAEEELDAIVTLFDQNIFSLDEQEQTAVREFLEPTREKLNEARQKNVDSFLSQFKPGKDMTVLAVPSFGDPVPVADLQPGTNVAEANEVWTTPAAAWAKYEEVHDEILARSDERYCLKKHDLGDVSRTREAARKQLRLHELEVDHRLRPVYREKRRVEDAMGKLELAGADKSSDEWLKLERRYDELAKQANEIADDAVNLVAVCTEVRQYETVKHGLQQNIEKNNDLVKKIAKRFGADSPMAAGAKKIVSQLNATETANMQQPDEKLSNLRSELARAPQDAQETIKEYFAIQKEADKEDALIKQKINDITAENERFALVMKTATGQEEPLVLDAIVRAYLANQVDGGEKAAIYGSRWWEFLSADPREANSEGGVFPAIWGTVIMTLIMALAVAPFGVLSALYLREYAKAGPIVSTVRISINNLAGVPSIVFGVFGLGFLCYAVGAYTDGGPENAGVHPWSAGRWYFWLLGLAVLSVSAFLVGVAGMTKPGAPITPLKQWISRLSTALWIAAVVTLAFLIVKTPFFNGFYEADLPNPVFGKGGVLWASLTLALLTLPVVIVATEEALAAVPNSMREGSYGCGASKWQTIRRIVLPHALPGIMTGMILAMARGAGEVAPLMLVGAVKLAPELPLDGIFPFVHPDRSFMHLGFHIFDLGFQSQDSEAARPMVFTTTLLLIVIIAALNIGAIWLRGRLRKRFQASQF